MVVLHTAPHYVTSCNVARTPHRGLPADSKTIGHIFRQFMDKIASKE
jgi:hypothetical protein